MKFLINFYLILLLGILTAILFQLTAMQNDSNERLETIEDILETKFHFPSS